MDDGRDGPVGSGGKSGDPGESTPGPGSPAAVSEPTDRRVLDPHPDHLRATLCHPIRERAGRTKLLLMEKKRGIGEGNVIAPGGKIEPGERPRECARRETREEVGVEVGAMEKAGELSFYFGEDPFTFVYVYRTREFSGDPGETAEGIPAWYDAADVPYGRMWDDDRYWLPHLIDGEPFVAEFRFDDDGDEVVDYDIRTGVEF